MSAATAFASGQGDVSDLKTVAELVYAHSGIVLPEEKWTLVRSRLAGPFRRTGLSSFGHYVAQLQNNEDVRREAINALTTNHTFFFRENHHFEHFTQAVRPDLISRIAAGERVRLWSAGSSSGEEVYSLALTLLGSDRAESATVLAGDVALLATDINANVLKLGAAGDYPAAASDAFPPALRGWAEVAGERLRFKPAVTGLVRFRRLNLLKDWPVRGLFDVIFCRNTMIYFDKQTKAQLLERLSDRLAPGGYLYIGHSERVIGPAAERLRPIGQTIYRKDDE